MICNFFLRSRFRLWAILGIWLTLTEGAQRQEVPIKGAIIGGGISGTSCAYFLNEFFHGRVSIDLFEKEAHVGGRIASVKIGPNHYEAGASIVHARNKYMTDLRNKFGFKKRKDKLSNVLGIFDGSKFVFTGSQYSLLSYAKLLWRYGYDIFRLSSVIDKMLDRFSRIYDLQSRNYAFTTVDGLLNAMDSDFLPLTTMTLEDYLLSEGFGAEFINELAQAAMRVNYGQDIQAHAFVGSVALAGAGNDLWAVDGGNKKIPEALFNRSKARLVRCDVQSVAKPAGSRKFDITCKPRSDDEHTELFTEYDFVIVAAPLRRLRSGELNIKFSGFQNNADNVAGPFHQTVATFVEGQLVPEAFNVDADHLVANEILLCNTTYPINSVSEICPAEKSYRRSVYKVFSQKPLSEQALNYMFKSRNQDKEFVWHAYPKYTQLPNAWSTSPREALPFEIGYGLYYINAIEWAASAMEMALIGSKNVALLVFNLLTNQHTTYTDTYGRPLREEL